MLQLLNQEINPLNINSMQESQYRWDSIAKPLNGLGIFEKIIVKISGITGNPYVNLEKKGVVVFCADNGVVSEGITQTSMEVTAVVTENMSRGLTSVCNMSKTVGADVIPVDIGVASEVIGEKILKHKIDFGTRNIVKGAAMTKNQALDAIEYGINLVAKLKEDGYKILATGEMGIGNTTTSSAVVSVLMGYPVEEVTGRGAGLSDEGLKRKIEIIKKAIVVNNPDPTDSIDVLCKVGGFDLAGLTGVFLGGAIHRVPIVIDGFISATAALIAKRIYPQVSDYMIASHVSKEPAAIGVLRELGLEATLNCGMCLGEGTGAAMMFPLLDMALSVYHNMATFGDIEIEEYKPL